MARPIEFPDPKMQLHLWVTKEQYKAFVEIAKRENLSNSELGSRLIDEYNRIHGAGNDSYKLTEFDKGLVRAFPTAWKQLSDSNVRDFTQEEFREMDKLLEQNHSFVHSRVIRNPEKQTKPEKSKFDEGDVSWMMSQYHLTREEALGHLSQERVLDVDAIKLSRETGDPIEECQRYLRLRREAQDAQTEREKQRRVVQWRAIK